MVGIPPFNDDGLLPPGDHAVTVDQLRTSILVTGPQPAIAGWDSDWRRHLVDGADSLIRQLWRVGVTEIYLNGSFAENKPHPNDIDGYFECDARDVATGSLQARLNALDPNGVWTWDRASRRPYRGYTKRQLPMWHVYRVELYPHYGQQTGVRDSAGNELIFPSAFRLHRDSDAQKGIVKILRHDDPHRVRIPPLVGPT